MRTWKLVGGLVAVAAVVGIFIGKMVPGLPSLGLPGFEQQSNPPASVATIPEEEKSPTPDQPPSDESKPELPAEANDSKVLYVEVDGAGYRVVSPEAGLRPATLDEIVQLAKDRPGSTEGIRIKVKRQETSKYQSEVDLRDKLVEAGIDNSAIVWLNGPPL